MKTASTYLEDKMASTSHLKSIKKIYIMTTSGRNFQVDAHEVIHNRATYYCQTDPDTNYEAEYKFMESCDEEITEWLFGNMKWFRCQTLQELPSDPKKTRDLVVDDYAIK